MNTAIQKQLERVLNCEVADVHEARRILREGQAAVEEDDIGRTLLWDAEKAFIRGAPEQNEMRESLEQIIANCNERIQQAEEQEETEDSV